MLNALVKQGTRSFPYSVIRETKKILKTKHKLTTVAADESFEEVLFSFDVDINYKKLVQGFENSTRMTRNVKLIEKILTFLTARNILQKLGMTPFIARLIKNVLIFLNLINILNLQLWFSRTKQNKVFYQKFHCGKMVLVS